MPRANRHCIPGCVWHITHRCHKREFLHKFEKDRNASKGKELWGESIAVGSEDFVNKIQRQLGSQTIGRTVVQEGEGCALKEARASYGTGTK